jgi:predicted extracellular nuclease
MTRLIVRFVCGSVVLVSMPCLGQGTPDICDDDLCIQVGSYNLELFGSRRQPYGGMDRGPRTDEEVERIADRIARLLDLEIVVFQEINTESNEWASLKAQLAAQGYQFFEGTTSDRNQFVVLAWDTDEVMLHGEAQELPVRDAFDFDDGCRETGLRKPVAGQFKAGAFDFWVIGVHLKSRSGTESCTTHIRVEQCRDLVEQVTRLASSSGERDVLLVGDFNNTLDHESFAPLVDAGFIPQTRFLTNDSANGSYVKNGDLHESDDLIDHVWLRYSETREVVRRSAFVMPLKSRADAKRYIVEQSDHVPIAVSFRIDEDLDDDE